MTVSRHVYPGVAPREGIDLPRISSPGTRAHARLAATLFSPPRSIATVAAGTIVLGLCVFMMLVQLTGVVIPEDEGMLLTYPWLMAKGWVLYRDIWTTYPPATFFALAALAKLGLAGLPAERAFGLLARIVYLLVVNRAVTGSWRRISWFPVALTFSLLFFVDINMRAYPWIVGTPLLIGGLLLARTRPPYSVALLFLAGMTRIEFATAGLVSLMALGILEHRSSAQSRRDLSIAAGLLASLAVANGLLAIQTNGQIIVDLFVDPLRSTSVWPRPPLYPPIYTFVGLPVLLAAVLCPLGLIVVSVVRRHPFIAATNLGMLTLVPHFLQWPDASHLYSLAAVTLPWGAVCIAELRRDTDYSASRILRLPELLAALAGFWAIMLVIAYGVYASPLSPGADEGLATLHQRAVIAGARSIVESSAVEAAADRQIMSYVDRHVPASAHIIILPKNLGSMFTRTDMYYALQRTPGTRYQMLLGLIAHRGGLKDLQRDVKASSWVIELHGGTWYEPLTTSLDRGMVESYLRRHFQVVDITPIYSVMRRKTW